MNKFTGTLAITFLAIAPAMAQKTVSSQPLQDSKKAVAFFQAELDFKTNPYGVNRMIGEQAKDITIVDVRSAKDYAEGHIPGAINVPYEKSDGFNGSKSEFPELTKDKMNIVYCYDPLCNLAQKAAKQFASNGYPVKEMTGGFQVWKESKYPVEK